jgi:CheY-like chemotaxis protein
MPVADGFEVAAFARSKQAAQANRGVPMLALTADAFEETRQRAKESGIDDFLAKPYTFEDLSRKSRELLATRAPIR